MNADGSNQVRLTSNGALDTYPDWSPDGARIIFYSKEDGQYAIYVMNADGSGQTNITDYSARDIEPSWGP